MAVQLTAQLNATNPRDSLLRSRIDTARAILADPQRRARYDAQLADPAAPTIDERALSAIAGRPVPTAPRTGLAGAFAETKAKILAAVVGALALVLVVAVTAVACSGEGSTPTASDRSPTSNNKSSTPSSSQEPSPSDPAASFDPLVTRGESFQYTKTSTAVIDTVAKVTDPAPGCTGEYYAATLTITNTEDGRKASPHQGRLSPYNAEKQTNHTAQDNQFQPSVSPIFCESESAWPTERVMPGQSTTANLYARVEGITDPIVLKVEANTGLGVYIEIPENLW